LYEFITFLGDAAVIILIFATLSLSVNLQYGSTGIFNFGIVAFFMIGAYTLSFLELAGFPFTLALAAAIALSGVAGLLISLPALNLRGDFLSLATFMFAEIIRLLVLNVPSLGGAVGIARVPSAFQAIKVYSDLVAANIVLSLAVFLVFCVVYWAMISSPYGRVLKCIRENEMLAESLGKNTFRYKAQVFAIGSVMAGTAGAVYSQYLGFAGTELFTYSVTFMVYIMSIIGGSTTLLGALLGSFIYLSIQDFLRIAKNWVTIPVDPNNLAFILFGFATMLILYYRPEGIIREKLRQVKYPHGNPTP